VKPMGEVGMLIHSKMPLGERIGGGGRRGDERESEEGEWNRKREAENGRVFV